ncbi:MAG TPA: hypothetical protein VMH28_33345 [Candidatus Acidoferrales bacterium]|nr:hypothetical protein [Candidatus Acidoferrales bacterium]
MFRSMSGFKAHYHYLTLLVVQEFNEWRVLVYGLDTTIQGTHQFSESKAKEHALAVAQSYIRDQRHEDLPALDDVSWEPTVPDDWLVWR